MKIATIVGARPQFIKAAAVSHELRRRHTEVLIHTGQHYDDGMSAVFFRDMDIPDPDYHLGIGSGSHGEQTGRMLMAIESTLQTVAPDWVLVYGDTNSTLAGALAAVKLEIPVAHIEAGLRSFNWSMPEECNRVLTDHCAALLLCPSGRAVENLNAEGRRAGVQLVGDVMQDALRLHLPRAAVHPILSELKLQPGKYLLATIHRASNTDDPAVLETLMQTLMAAQEDVVLPLHPRTAKCLPDALRRRLEASRVRVIAPQGYLPMLALTRAARLVLTDSGGLQKEAYWCGVPCITLRDETEWTETVEAGWNQLVGADPVRIANAIRVTKKSALHPSLYGEGDAGARCVKAIEDAAASGKPPVPVG